MDKYRALSHFTAQGIMILYIIGYMIGVEIGMLLLGTIVLILFTIGFDILYKKTRTTIKSDLVGGEWNSTKFVYYEKLNLYSKVYCIAGLLGLPLALTIDPGAQATFIVLAFFGLLLFSYFGSNKYFNKRLAGLKAELENYGSGIFETN